MMKRGAHCASAPMVKVTAVNPSVVSTKVMLEEGEMFVALVYTKLHGYIAGGLSHSVLASP